MFRRLVSSLLITIMAIVVLATIAWQWFQKNLHEPLALPESGYELVVDRGAGINVVGNYLVEEHILESSLALKIYARINELSDIKAGDYLLVPGETLLSLLEKLTRGSVQQYSITFPEGWTLKQWRIALARTENIDHTLGNRSNGEIAESLGISHTNPEGWFAPDTYVYISGDSDLSLLQRAHENMTGQLGRLWLEKDPDLPYETPYDALVMASIIEKETGVAEERPTIAGVFVSRLRKGMLLQTDPTVIYGLGEDFEGNLTRQHLQQASIYNTYLNAGLPPTPIANPGLAAIEAALHPIIGKDLFFVGKGDGSHYFSATLAEHNRAVRRYQLDNRAKAYRSSPGSHKTNN